MHPPADPRPLPVPLSFVSGFCMGGADAVPGVSGGTIALILGVYERLIDNIGTLLAFPSLIGKPEGRQRLKQALFFLVPLGVGLLAAYWLVTRLLVGPKDQPGLLIVRDTAPICYAFFFGLVIASLREPWRRIQSPGPRHLGLAVLGAAAAAAFVHLPHSGQEPEAWMLLYGGAGAVTVMLLPGISGSLLLVVLGQYTTVAGAVHDREIATLGIFLVGIVLGLALFVPVLRRLLRRYPGWTMAVLTGLMAGSLFALWPWKNQYEPKAAPMHNVAPFGDMVPVLLSALAGAATVMLLAWLERRIQRAGESPPTSSSADA